MSDDDDWDTDPDFKNDLTDAQRRAFGNKETMDAYTKAHGGGDIGGAVERAPVVKPKSTAETLAETEAEEAAEAATAPPPAAAPAPAPAPSPAAPLKLPGRISMPTLQERDLGEGLAPSPRKAESAQDALSSLGSVPRPSMSPRASTTPRAAPRGSVFGAVANRSLGEDELKNLRTLFNSFDADKSGHIDMEELQAAMTKLGLSTTKEKLHALVHEADQDADKKISFDEFISVVQRGKVGPGVAFTDVVTKQQAHLMQDRKGHIVHSFAKEECLAFVNHINRKLGDDPECAYLLPLSVDDVGALFSSVVDGVLLCAAYVASATCYACKLINIAVPETIDERTINIAPSNRFHITENLNLAINAAKGIGLTVVNIGAADLIEGKPHLMVKMMLLSNINLKANPNLIRLLQEGETIEMLLKLPPEKLLMRWFNHHLEASGCKRRLNNWGTDLQAAPRDSELYAHLLKQIDPDKVANTKILLERDQMARASYVVSQGARMGAEFKVQPEDIVKANEKLNLGFVAALFNACPGLDPPDESNLAALAELPDDDGGDSREERAFRMWINSLGIEQYVHNLFDDIADGTFVLQTMDHVRPGVVEWSRVNKNAKQIFKKIENLNYAVDLGKSPFKFSLVGVQGNDIVNGNKKLTLALIWQLMRYHLVSFLEGLRKNSSLAGGKPLTDADIVSWANETVAASGGTSTMRDLGDKSLGSGVFLIDLLAAVEPRCVDREKVMAGGDEEERKLNAKYAISAARKLGCSVFVLWEDIVEVRPKMVLSFVAAVMAFALENGVKGRSPPVDVE